MKPDERLIEALAPIIDPVPWEPRWDDDARGPKARAESLEWTRDLIARINASGIAWVAPLATELSDEAWEEAINAVFAQKRAGAKRLKLVPAERLAAAETRIAELEAALHKIAYEPFGSAEATDAEVLLDIGLEARAALAARAAPPTER